MKRLKALKKLLTATICGLLTLLMFFCIGCGPNKVNPNPVNPDKPKLPTSEFEDGKNDEEYVDNTPEDTGTLSDHFFEAEAADFIGTSTNGTTSLGGKCIAKSHFFDLSFGGNIMIRNITSTSNKYIFQFKSDKAVKVKMEVAVASAYTSTWVERNLSAMFDIVVNDRQVTDDVVVPAGNKDQIRGGNNYTCIQKVEIPVSLKEGDNLIVFNVLAGVCNLDYINLKTSAAITDYTEHYWEDTDTKITVANLPTAQKAGDLVFKCDKHGATSPFKLPILSQDSGYTVTESGGVKTYSFKLYGQTFSFSDDGTYKVPDGVEVTEPEVPDVELEPEGEETVDPDAPVLPEKKINGKDIFTAANWTTFTKGDAGAKPEKINGAMKFTDAARFDFFYVPKGTGGNIHLGEMAGKYEGLDIYGKDYAWELEMSARHTFEMLLFATQGTPSSYSQASCSGVYLTIEKDKISVKNAWYNAESTEVVAQGTIPQALTFDGKTKFKIKINVNRADGNNLRFGLEVNGVKIDLTATGKGKLATVADGVVNLQFTSAGSYGQRLCIMPRYANNIVRIYGITAP